MQEFCALQECSLTPVLVRPVEQESTAAVDVEIAPIDVEEVRIEPAVLETNAENSTTDQVESTTQGTQDPIALG